MGGRVTQMRGLSVCFVDRASLYNLLQTEPTWCTNVLNMFIAFLYMFRATTCP